MKLKQFQKDLHSKGIGLSLFFSIDGDNVDPNLVYFSQYTGLGALAITPKRAFLIVPKAEYLRAKKTSKVPVFMAKKRFLETLKSKFRKIPKKVGIDKDRISMNFYSYIRKILPAKYVDISDSCRRLRASKSKEELNIIRKACEITDEIASALFWNFRKFKTEAEVSAFIIHEANKRGLGISFKPIVASGSNAAQPHHASEDNPLKKGFCVIDFGVKYKGYCSDMTRTIYLGTPTKKEVELYYKVLRVQQELIDMCEEGESFVDIDTKARELFGDLAEKFTHPIGHGVGTEIHENPNPKKSNRRPITKLLKDSVITIEPGLYFDNKLGIRIEDDIHVTEKGPVILNKTGKHLLIIKGKVKCR